ncbi:MAG: ankyrin repeat domain-containing protein [Planctomycetota bacterium]
MNLRLDILGDSGTPDGPGPEAPADELIEAVHRGDAPAVKRLIEAVPQRTHVHVELSLPVGDEIATQQWLPLHHAAALGDAAIVAMLLDAGGHPDARTRAATPDAARATALHLAAAGGHLPVIDLLLDAHAEPNVIDADGYTPLAYAGAPAVRARLIDGGADPAVGRGME